MTLLFWLPKPARSRITCAMEVTDTETGEKTFEPVLTPVVNPDETEPERMVYVLIKPTILPELEKKADK